MDVGSMFDDPLRVERVMSGTPATLFRTWAANWSCALPTAPRAGLPQPLVLGVQNVVVIVRGLQRALLFQVNGGQDSQPARAGWLLGPGLDVGDGGLDHMHSATSRCDMHGFALATLPGPVRLQQATPRTGPYPWAWLIGVLGADTSVRDDDLWVVESTPLKCARRPRVKRSDLAGWAQGRSSRSVLAATWWAVRVRSSRAAMMPRTSCAGSRLVPRRMTCGLSGCSACSWSPSAIRSYR